jgi:hypothetical protein
MLTVEGRRVAYGMDYSCVPDSHVFPGRVYSVGSVSLQSINAGFANRLITCSISKIASTHYTQPVQSILP